MTEAYELRNMIEAEQLEFAAMLRGLTPEQWAELLHCVAREAHAARAQSLRTSLRALFGFLRRPGVPARLVAAAARGWWTAYGTWRERRRAVRALGALDDRSLKDMGLHRSEIESAVSGQGSAPPPSSAAPVSVQGHFRARGRAASPVNPSNWCIAPPQPDLRAAMHRTPHRPTGCQSIDSAKVLRNGCAG